MAVSCPIDFDVATLRAEVRTMYSRVATSPDGEFHFHRGPTYASAMLGYDAAELAVLPVDVTSSFAGVGNPHAIGPIPPGATVVDIGCGAGMDLLLAARRAGARGRAIGVDMTEPMRRRAQQGAVACGLDHVDVREGDATRLPIEDRSADVVISNGVLNLVPNKERAVAEIARVLRPGGRVQIADIIIGEVLPDSALRDIDLWTGWIAGALLEAEMIDIFISAGFADVALTHRYDCFEGTTKAATARRYGVQGVNVSAVREGRTMASRAVTRSLDLRGQVCPGPTVDTRLTLKEMNAGEVLEVITDYYPARQTIPALMSELGYPCELVDGDKDVFRFFIEKAQ